jgi:CBS domain-containing protein
LRTIEVPTASSVPLFRLAPWNTSCRTWADQRETSVNQAVAAVSFFNLVQQQENPMPTVSDVMTRDVEVIAPQETLQRAAQLMDELNVGALPVCEGNRLLGMITDRDITVRAVAAGSVPAETRVSEVMSEGVRWVREDDSTDAVTKSMGGMQVRRVPVLNSYDELVGIVSLGDLSTQRIDEADAALREISQPSEPDR